jgi:hypothetical protein
VIALESKFRKQVWKQRFESVAGFLAVRCSLPVNAVVSYSSLSMSTFCLVGKVEHSGAVVFLPSVSF